MLSLWTMAAGDDAQPSLFDVGPKSIAAADPAPEHVQLAQRLPATLRMGGMSWSYRGWIGPVYGASASERLLAARGLTAYHRHPLLRCVEIDRSYYEPLPAATFAELREQVDDQFRFVVKAHEVCTVERFPEHARYGKRRGEQNPYFLDPGYATDAVVGPTVEGLGATLGCLLFQFSPMDASNPLLFARRLATFLRQLPAGVCYAVELRNRELLTPAYAQALGEGGAVHCHNGWTAMPPVLTQAKLLPPATRRPLLMRWLLRRGARYEDANTRFAPFHRLVEEDVETRGAIAELAVKAAKHHVPTMALVDNKAEGCAPESIVRLAGEIAKRAAAAPA